MVAQHDVTQQFFITNVNKDDDDPAIHKKIRWGYMAVLWEEEKKTGNWIFTPGGN